VHTSSFQTQILPPLGELQAIAPFFHPLDGVQDWNKFCGPAGYLQYQFAVPNEAAHMVPRTLEALRKVGAPSSLTVLKRFGPSNPAPLPFPIPGWTLAGDVPAAVPRLLEVLNELDEEVAAARGRLYIAKDSRQIREMFLRSYLALGSWRSSRGLLDPPRALSSSLSERIL
jgi:decaprenylphospho-beta-D-ribofuranose 2-oxidase